MGVPDSLSVNLPGLPGFRGVYHQRVARTYGGNRYPRGGASPSPGVDGHGGSPAGIPAAFGVGRALFAFLKNQLGARRFTLRGMDNVKAEWAMLATAFNLRTLWRVWRHRGCPEPDLHLTGHLSGSSALLVKSGKGGKIRV